MSTFVGLILAAGEGKRFGGPKAEYVFEGERLVDRAVRLMREAGAQDVYVVLGAWQGDVSHADIVHNPEWESGMGSSLRAGLEHLQVHSSADRVVITLVDLPGLTAPAITEIADNDSPISVATYLGQRGHPVAFNRQLWLEVAAEAHEDVGARDFLKGHPDLVTLVDVSHLATGEDLDFRPQK
ncbi:MAG: NTP transferase domain-containing protein [Actinobacteria bacterium]|uniref:Unannotated protein n=1 Tax=freshwater metagenome TaxID=449393 RepID=A0A6J5Z079_9ZZZZ|nr:NTP transferase domain-containing protein [Actinomycetota bacterium]